MTLVSTAMVVFDSGFEEGARRARSGFPALARRERRALR
jgi:hypothetical protein